MNEEQFLQLNPAKQKYLLQSKDKEMLKLKTQILMQACLSGHLSTIELLIKDGVDLNVGLYEADNVFYTPVLKAISSSQLEVLKYLKNNGANISAKNNFYLAVSLGNISIIEYLTQKHPPFWDELSKPGMYMGPISNTVIQWIETEKIIKTRAQIEKNLEEVQKNNTVNTLALNTKQNKI